MPIGGDYVYQLEQKLAGSNSTLVAVKCTSCCLKFVFSHLTGVYEWCQQIGRDDCPDDIH